MGRRSQWDLVPSCRPDLDQRRSDALSPELLKPAATAPSQRGRLTRGVMPVSPVRSRTAKAAARGGKLTRYCRAPRRLSPSKGVGAPLSTQSVAGPSRIREQPWCVSDRRMLLLSPAALKSGYAWLRLTVSDYPHTKVRHALLACCAAPSPSGKLRCVLKCR
jgi:hypothetical protein